MMQHSLSDELCFTLPTDPYLSPYWASDEVLRQLPPTKIMSVQMDPFLDDCVMFAKKLKNLGVAVSLDILDGLPHGFLNFSQLSKEARSGSNLCVKRIQELLCI
jgi:hormone-sensitive lipase